jgi:hypothetical protein
MPGKCIVQLMMYIREKDAIYQIIMSNRQTGLICLFHCSYRPTYKYQCTVPAFITDIGACLAIASAHRIPEATLLFSITAIAGY